MQNLKFNFQDLNKSYFGIKSFYEILESSNDGSINHVKNKFANKSIVVFDTDLKDQELLINNFILDSELRGLSGLYEGSAPLPGGKRVAVGQGKGKTGKGKFIGKLAYKQGGLLSSSEKSSSQQSSSLVSSSPVSSSLGSFGAPQTPKQNRVTLVTLIPLR